MKNISVSCGAPSVIPDLLQWNQFDIIGTVRELDLCNDEDQKSTKLIPVQLDFQAASRLCEIMGAKLSFPTEWANLEQSNDCSELRVSPIIKNNQGHWIDHKTEKEVDL